jgi:hypothetical protein
MRPVGHVSVFAPDAEREVLTSRRGVKCERRLFPSPAFVRVFIDSVVAPIPRRQLSLPAATSEWEAQFLDNEEIGRVTAALALVCSSYTATLAEEEFYGGYTIANTTPIPEGLGGVCRRAVFAPVIRFLPLDLQRAYAIASDNIDLNLGWSPAQERMLYIYEGPRVLRVIPPAPFPIEDRSCPVYLSTLGHHAILTLARASGRHPLVEVARTSLKGVLRGTIPETTIAAIASGNTNDDVPRSFCFPINFGVADAIDCPWQTWLGIRNTLDGDFGFNLAAEFPLFGLPIQFRQQLLDVAAEFDGLADQARGDRRTRRRAWTALGLLVRWFMPLVGLGIIAFDMLHTSVRNEIASYLGDMATSIRLAAVAVQGDPDPVFERNTTAATAIAMLFHAFARPRPFRRLREREARDRAEQRAMWLQGIAHRMRPRTSFVDALAQLQGALPAYRPTRPTPAVGRYPGIPVNPLHTPVIHVAARRLVYDFAAYEQLDGLTEYSTALSPTLQFRDTLNLAMDIYQQALNSESAWHNLYSVVQSQGVLAAELAALNDPTSAQLVALRTLFGSVPQSKVLAFIWRQVVVDNFIQTHRAFVARVAAGPLADGSMLGSGSGPSTQVVCEDRVLYEAFCWMRTRSNREVLDRVLGPVVRSAVSPRWSRDLSSGLFGKLFAADRTSLDPTPLRTALRRFRALPAEVRCDVWPRFLEIVANDEPCTGYERVERADDDPFLRIAPRPSDSDELEPPEWRQRPGWRRPLGTPAPFEPVPGWSSSSPSWTPGPAPCLCAGPAPMWR